MDFPSAMRNVREMDRSSWTIPGACTALRGTLPRVPGEGTANAFGLNHPSTLLWSRYGLTPGTQLGRWFPPPSPFRRLSVPRLTVWYGPDLILRIGENCQPPATNPNT